MIKAGEFPEYWFWMLGSDIRFSFFSDSCEITWSLKLFSRKIRFSENSVPIGETKRRSTKESLHPRMRYAPISLPHLRELVKFLLRMYEYMSKINWAASFGDGARYAGCLSHLPPNYPPILWCLDHRSANDIDWGNTAHDIFRVYELRGFKMIIIGPQLLFHQKISWMLPFTTLQDSITSLP